MYNTSLKQKNLQRTDTPSKKLQIIKGLSKQAGRPSKRKYSFRFEIDLQCICLYKRPVTKELHPKPKYHELEKTLQKLIPINNKNTISIFSKLLNQAHGTPAALFVYNAILRNHYKESKPLTPRLVLQSLKAIPTYYAIQECPPLSIFPDIIATIIREYTAQATLPQEFIAAPSVTDATIQYWINNGLLGPASQTTDLNLLQAKLTTTGLQTLLESEPLTTLTTLHLNLKDNLELGTRLILNSPNLPKLQTLKILLNDTKHFLNLLNKNTHSLPSITSIELKTIIPTNSQSPQNPDSR